MSKLSLASWAGTVSTCNDENKAKQQAKSAEQTLELK